MNNAMASLVLCIAPSIVQAQFVGAPTYDWVPDNPSQAETIGVQPPISTRPGGLLEGFDHHDLRQYQVTFNLSVPLTELQATLPPGFTAVASAPGAATATLTVALVVGQSGWNAGYPDISATNYVAFFTVAMNTSLGRPETVTLAIEAANPAFVEVANAKNGPGISRLADVEVQIKSEGDAMDVRFTLKDKPLGLELRAEAYCPFPIDEEAHVDPDSRIWRLTDGHVARGAFHQAFKGFFRSVTLEDSQARVEAKKGYLHLPGGSVRVLGLVGPTILFNRNYDYFRKNVAP